MQAIILAAGRGSRLNQATDDRPKCLVELKGRPLLRHQIDALTAGGAGPLGAVRGYRGDRLEGFGLTLFDNPRWAETNIVASLRCAGPWLTANSTIVSYSDIFYDPRLVTRLIAAKGDIVVAYDPAWAALWQRRFADPLSDAESFRLAPDGAIAEIGATPRSLEEVEGQYMGLLRFTPQGFKAVEAAVASLGPHSLTADSLAADRLDMTSLLSLLIARGVRLTALRNDWPWGEVDSPSDLALYEAMP